MGKMLKGMAREISHSLTNEIGTPLLARTQETEGISTLLFQYLANEVARQLGAGSKEVATVQDLDSRLQALEATVGSLVPNEQAGDGDEGVDQDEDEDEVDGKGSSFPNLKYAKPKYKDMDSVLRYVDEQDGGGGIKLVIMNFND